MYGNVNVCEMRMPAHYVDMTADEMEYDGGFFGIALSLVGIAVSCVAVATGDKTLGYISNGLTVAGAITSFGVGALATKGVSIAASALVKRGTAKVLVKNPDALGNYLAGVGLDAGSTVVGVATWS